MKLKDTYVGICIWSENYEALATWYEQVLQFPVRQRLSFPTDTGIDFNFGENYFFIGKHDRVYGKSKDPYRIMIGFNVESVKKTYQELVEKGVTIVAKPFQSPSGTFWCMTVADPEKNILQFYGDE